MNLPTDDEIKKEFEVYLSYEEHDSIVKKPAKPKAKEPHVNKDVYTILPFSEPKTKTCGTYVPYHFGHISRFPDRANELGELEHSVHVIGPAKGGRVPESLVINCNSITCEYCNYHHDLNGNVILDKKGHPVPNGAWKRTIKSHSDKLRKFQNMTGEIAKRDSAKQDFFRLFYGKKKTNHAKHDVFYTLIDRKMGVRQRRNLNWLVNHISERHIPLNIYHHVLSPPSTWDSFETEEGTKKNIDRAIDILREIGCIGGYIYFHPYRIPEKYNYRIKCANGPHFHFVGFSHIMTDVQAEVCEREKGKNDKDKMIFKELHYKNGHVEPVGSIEETIKYVTSHVGVQRSKEPVVRDLLLLEKYKYVEASNTYVNGKEVPFILPDRESNFDLDHFKFPKEPLIVSPDVFSNSLSFYTFLKTEGGRLFQLMRRHIKLILDQHDSISYSISIKSNIRKKDRKIVMRNFGILSNSKNFIWGYKREKPQYYCESCGDRVPLVNMFPCRVLSESLIGVKGPPPVPDKDCGLIEDLDYTEAKKAYDDYMKDTDSIQEKIQEIKEANIKHNLEPIDHRSNKDGWYSIGREDTTIYIDSKTEQYLKPVPPHELHNYYEPSSPNSEIYKVPLQYIQRLDINCEDAIRHFYKIRR